MTPASPLVLLGMLLLPLSVAIAIVALAARHLGRRAAARSALELTATLAMGGVFARFDVRPPPMMPFVLATLGLTALFAFSRVGLKTGQSVPMAALVGLQSFRLPLELVMHRAAVEGAMPLQMSYSGLNFDILTGASAIVVALLAARGRAQRWLLVAWNVAGLALVLAIVGIAVASTPLFEAFGSDPSRVNTFVTRFPMAWLPTFLVPVALAGHAVMLRRLLGRGA